MVFISLVFVTPMTVTVVNRPRVCAFHGIGKLRENELPITVLDKYPEVLGGISLGNQHAGFFCFAGTNSRSFQYINSSLFPLKSPATSRNSHSTFISCPRHQKWQLKPCIFPFPFLCRGA